MAAAVAAAAAKARPSQAKKVRASENITKKMFSLNFVLYGEMCPK